MSRRVLTLCLAVSLAGAAGCSRNPATGERQLSLISESQAIQMGEEGAQQIIQSVGLVDNQELQQYVSGIGQQLAAGTERPNLPWEFYVLDDAAVNAFALPGGKIFVTRGIFTHMTTEAQLAGVLGHEIGHVTAEHAVTQISRAQLAQLGLGLGSILSEDIERFSGVASVGLSLLFLKHGRDDENQADELGFRYMLNQQYDPRAMVDMFQILERVSQMAEQGGLPEWLSTHPNPENRVERTRARLDTLSVNFDTLTSDRGEYLRRVDGLVFGENPRNGFFRDSHFYHPELAFQVTFPEGWQTANMAQAVVAVSPEGDAAVELTLAEGAPDQAAQQFFTQQGVRSADVSSGSVNGLPAVSGYFEAQTQQGVVQGIASFISYGDRTYQLIAYTPAGGLNAYEAAFRQVIDSFDRLTDPDALNVEPARIEIVELPRDMSVEEFYRRYPSSVPIEEIALINGVESPSTVVSAGRLMKRVVGGVGG